MKIGLLIAIDRELAAFLQSGEERTEETVAGKTVYRTRMEGHEVYAVKSGCGEIDAAAATTLLIVKYGCGIILNFGVTGALEEDLKVEDLFVVEKACYYDFDLSAVDGLKKGQYGEYPDEFIPLDKELADTLRRNRTIDWQKRSSARAKMRMLIKKLLKKHKYPPEGMEDAVQTVMTQCELWTDNYPYGHRQDMPDSRYEYEVDISVAAEGKAVYN